MFLSLLIALNLHAGSSDPAPDFLNGAERAAWAKAACTWRIGRGPDRTGWVETTDRRECFAVAKYNAITLDQISTVRRDDVFVAFDDGRGRRELCRLIPARAAYEAISWDDVTAAIDAGGTVLDELLKRVNENLTEDCEAR